MTKLLPGNYSTRIFEQDEEDFQRPVLKSGQQSFFAKLADFQIDFEQTETDHPPGWRSLVHKHVQGERKSNTDPARRVRQCQGQMTASCTSHQRRNLADDSNLTEGCTSEY